MENVSILNTLKELIEEHKTKSLQLLIGESSKRITSVNCDVILKMIEGLKDAEKEQSRLDWKAGYIDCCLDCAEFFGNDRNESYPTESEMEEIDEDSFEFIKSKY
jgi:hypothetical protein